MNFLESTSKGFAITAASLRVVMLEPWMIVLPLIAMLPALLLLVLIFSGIGPAARQVSMGMGIFALILAVYFLSYFISVFMQAMIVHAAARRFEGKDPTITESCNAAAGILPNIILFSVIGAGAGLIINAISGNRGKHAPIGGMMGAGLKIAWLIATYFSIPVMLEEKKGVFGSFGRSAELVKGCWGEGVAANISTLAFQIPGMVVLIAGFSSGNAHIAVAGAGLLLLAQAIIIPTRAVISQALYAYATKKAVPPGFDGQMIGGMFGKPDGQ